MHYGLLKLELDYAMESSSFIALVTTFFFVSITPGMCMTLALTLGMTLGLRCTMWMMLGELVGVSAIILLSMLGVATLVMQYPLLFVVLRIVGVFYLLYLGIRLWRSQGKMPINPSENVNTSGRWVLINQGFVTAIANPKGWAFFIALLPPFIHLNQPLWSQLSLLMLIILSLELLSLMVYALGGKSLGRLLKDSKNVRLLNRTAGTLMIGVAVWLVMG